jgi:hypothetical protein
VGLRLDHESSADVGGATRRQTGLVRARARARRVRIGVADSREVAQVLDPRTWPAAMDLNFPRLG